MEFLKRNIGFLILLLVTVVLLAGCVLFWVAAVKTSSEFEQKVEAQKMFMAEVKRSQHTLSKPNVQTALANRELAEAIYRNLIRGLVQRYSVPLETGTGMECVRILKDEILRLHTELKEKNVLLGGTAQYLSFDSVAKSASLPNPADVPRILKQLRIVNELVRVVIKSGVMELREVSRPAGLRVIDKGMYELYPFEIVVSGEYKQIQRLVNQLQREAKGIFILRSIDITSKDQAAGGAVAHFNALTALGTPTDTNAAAGMPGGMMDQGMPGMMMPGGMQPGMQPGGMPGRTTAAARGTAKAKAPERSKLLDVDKEQRTVFQTHELGAVIVVDYIEFKKLPEEK